MKHSTTRTQNITHIFRRPWMRVFLMVLLPVILASAVWGQTAAQQTGVPKLVQVKGLLKIKTGNTNVVFRVAMQCVGRREIAEEFHRSMTLSAN